MGLELPRQIHYLGENQKHFGPKVRDPKLLQIKVLFGCSVVDEIQEDLLYIVQKVIHSATERVTSKSHLNIFNCTNVGKVAVEFFLKD